MLLGQLRDIIWRNKHSKTHIYKTCVRSILTYRADIRSETKKTKQIMRTTEMKTLSATAGRTLRDRGRNTRIRKECGIEDVVKFVRNRRRYWRNQVQRMNKERLSKQVMTGKPDSRRPPERPPKIWKDSWISTSN